MDDTALGPRPSQGLYVKSAPPPRQPSTAWRIIRWVFVLVLAGVCLVSVFFNVIASSVLAGSGDGKMTEKHIAGPSAFTASAKVAVVTVDGVLMGDQESGPAAWILRQLDRAQADSKVRAILLDVNSPGGGITTSDIIHDRIVEVQKLGKKVVVIMGDVAASGAYYISAPADEIIAQPTTITGSIGVLISSFNIEGLLDKIGVRTVVFKSSPNKDMLSLYRSPTEEEARMLQDITDEMYGRFTDIVKEGRGLTDEETEAASTGAIFTAKQALDLKLIDKIGYFDDAVAAARSAAGASDVAVVRYERPATLAEHLFGSSGPEGGLEQELSSVLKSRQAGFYYLWPGP